MKFLILFFGFAAIGSCGRLRRRKTLASGIKSNSNDPWISIEPISNTLWGYQKSGNEQQSSALGYYPEFAANTANLNRKVEDLNEIDQRYYIVDGNANSPLEIQDLMWRQQKGTDSNRNNIKNDWNIQQRLSQNKGKRSQFANDAILDQPWGYDDSPIGLINSRQYQPNQATDNPNNNIHKTPNVIQGGANSVYGYGNQLSGETNAIWGDINQIQGDKNAVVGKSNNLRGSDNQVNGDQNDLKGDFNNALGSENDIYGNNNTVIGDSNRLSGTKNQIKGVRNSVSGHGNVIY